MPGFPGRGCLAATCTSVAAARSSRDRLRQPVRPGTEHFECDFLLGAEPARGPFAFDDGEVRRLLDSWSSPASTRFSASRPMPQGATTSNSSNTTTVDDDLFHRMSPCETWRRDQFGVERLQPLDGTDVVPASRMQLARSAAAADRPAQQRQQRKFPGLAARKQLRAIDADPRIGMPQSRRLLPPVPSRAGNRPRACCGGFVTSTRCASESRGGSRRRAPKSMSVHTSPFTSRNGADPSSGSARKMPPPVSRASGRSWLYVMASPKRPPSPSAARSCRRATRY